ncbi:hypothetical protein [Spongiimicrobium salis]|uniref:hypothetical protein n=1 Tax=Spongiimicrobium salis TaxID=1667022 RepID=UPI00374D48C7
MKRLTQKETEHILSYLKDLGVLYVDLRFEMMDHIATDIELRMERQQLPFPKAFEIYKAGHEKSLKQWKRSFNGIILKRIRRNVGKQLRKPIILIICLLSFIVLKGLSVFIASEKLVEVTPMLTLLVVFLSYIFYYGGRTQRYAALEKIVLLKIPLFWGVLLFINPRVQVLEILSNTNVKYAVVAAFVGLFAAFLITTHQYYKHFKSHYKTI